MGAATASRPRAALRGPTAVAAVAASGAAVVLDLVASAGVGHVVGLGALSVAVGVARCGRWGREHPVTAAAASAAVVAQPALHVVDQLWERATAALEPTHALVHVALLVVHVGLVVATALGVAAADALVLVLAGSIGRLVRLATTPRWPSPDAVRRRLAATPERALRPLDRLADAARRGPPGASRVA